jgi:hypothetical protein
MIHILDMPVTDLQGKEDKIGWKGSTVGADEKSL